MRKFLPLLAALIIGLGGCSAGQTARNEAAIPAMDLAAAFEDADGVADDTDRGINDALADGDITGFDGDVLFAEAATFFAAIDDEDASIETVTAVSASWPILRPYADRGVDARFEAGEIGATAQGLGHERVQNFEDALIKVITPPTP